MGFCVHGHLGMSRWLWGREMTSEMEGFHSSKEHVCHGQTSCAPIGAPGHAQSPVLETGL